MDIPEQWRNLAEEFGRLHNDEQKELAGDKTKENLFLVSASPDAWAFAGNDDELLRDQFHDLATKAGKLLNYPLAEFSKFNRAAA